MHPFARLNPDLQRHLQAGLTLLTPNERLAREYRRHFDLLCASTGQQAWRTPAIYSLRDFLRTQYSTIAGDPGDGLPFVSRSDITHAARLARPDMPSHHLHSFYTAWSLCRGYDIDRTRLTEHPQTAFFGEWWRDCDAYLPESYTCEPTLGDYLIDVQARPRSGLVLTHVDELTRPQQRYLDFAAEHVDVLYAPDEPLPPGDDILPAAQQTVPLLEADTLQTEITAACTWAKDVKLHDPDATIGIVVPDLASRMDLVLAHCGAVLDPDGGSTSAAFDITGGTALSSQPVWRHAWRLLRTLLDDPDQADVAALAASPYLQIDRLTEFLRKRWPDYLGAHVTLAALARAAQSETLHKLSETRPHADSRQTWPVWLGLFQEWLQTAAWPVLSDTGSSQYQAWRQIEARLQALVSASAPDDALLTCGQALDLLQNDFEAQVFAPARAPADILIMGLLETTGLQFSHLWVCGMDNETLPAKNLSHPYLPRQLATAHGIPRSTSEQELEFARRLVRRWQAAAGTLRMSYTREDNDGEREPCALIAPITRPADAAFSRAQASPYTRPTQVALEPYIDIRGAPLASAHSRGGTGLLRDQAECPLRAYAVHRLGLRASFPADDLPSRLQRGHTLHAALESLFSEFTSHAEIARIETQALRSHAATAVRKARAALPQRFATHEVERVTALLAAWLETERQRTPFVVQDVEASFEIELNGLTVRLRLDRLDRVDGDLLVIDYKSGQTSLAGVLELPLTATQLPAYSLVAPDVAGVYYAHISADKTALMGVASHAGLTGCGKVLEAQPDWATQRAVWRDELERLAAHFRAGHAEATPASSTCRNCHLGGLCRVRYE